MDFKQILLERYATKKFDGRDIGQDKLNSIIDMARYTPSAINLQPWKVKVIADRAMKEKLLPLAWNQQQVTTCSHLLIFCANTDYEGHIAMLINHMKAGGMPEENVKGMETFMGNFVKNMPPEHRLSEAQAHAFMAAVTAIYAAKSLGIDSCPMQGFDVAGVSKALDLPSNLVPTLLVPLGYPADKQMPKFRFPKEEMIF
jgi:nitroreductase / dihydropteridine reductase